MKFEDIIIFVISGIKGIIGFILSYIVGTNDKAKSKTVTNEKLGCEEEENFIRKKGDDKLEDFYIGGIDDVIYQEFGCSTTNAADKEVYSNINCMGGSFNWFLKCVKYSTIITLVAGFFIGICSTCIMLLHVTTVGACPEKLTIRNESLKIFHKNVTAESVTGWFLQFISLFSMYLAFGWRLIADLHLLEWNISGAFLDTIFRFYLVIFDIYGDWRHYPLNCIFLVLTLLNCYKIAKYSCGKRKEQCSRFHLTLQLGVQFFLGLGCLLPVNYVIIWLEYKEFNSNQVYVAALLPIVGMFVRCIVRIISSAILHLNHPGSHYAFVLYIYASTSLLTRTFHAEITSLRVYIAFCFLHGVAGLIERLFLNFKSKFVNCISQITKTNKCQLFKTDKKAPRLQRMLADLTICNLIQEVNALVYSNAFISLYILKFGVNHKRYSFQEVTTNFVIRILTSVGIEFILFSYTIFSVTWYRNIPVIKVWRKKWKRLLFSNLVCSLLMTLYMTHYLVSVIVVKFEGRSGLSVQEVQRKCHELEYLYFRNVANGKT